MKKKVLAALFLICAIMLQPVCLAAAEPAQNAPLALTATTTDGVMQVALT